MVAYYPFAFGEMVHPAMQQMYPAMRQMFGNDESVTISLDRYENLKAEPARLREDTKVQVSKAKDAGRLEMFCQLVQRDLQVDIERLVDPLRITPCPFEVV